MQEWYWLASSKQKPKPKQQPKQKGGPGLTFQERWESQNETFQKKTNVW